MKILENIQLKNFTSMYVGGPARYFIEVKSREDLLEALNFSKEKKLPYFILGGGSNVLVSDSGFSGVVMKMCILGKKAVSETDKYVDYEVNAGENWDNFVKFAVNKNLYGIENMSHVPGTVGASVIQNIGCYGQEVSTSVVSVRAINVLTLEFTTFQKNDLLFSYRKSRFNDALVDKGKWVVTSVTFRLQKFGLLNMNYGDIKKYFSENKNISPNLKTIRKAIIKIRDNKFPFPDSPKHGTAGSFWNVPVVQEKTYLKVIKKLREKGFEKKAEEMLNNKSVFTVDQGYKLAPGLFVETLGFKGKSFGGAKVLEKHAGIINNFTGKAKALDVFKLSKEIIDSVQKQFGIQMKIEPELVGDFKII
jgi:UDP-N-acetylmuramate dehydrogenase